MQTSTEISLATVTTRQDPDKNGTFYAKIHSAGNAELPVYYVSPYGSGGEGAFYAIPQQHVVVLVCKPEGSNSWYYLGSTFSPETLEDSSKQTEDADLKPLQRVDPYIYRSRGVPMRLGFRGNYGEGLVLSEEYGKDPVSGKPFFNIFTELRSATKKKISLNDSPGQDAIVISSGNGSKITIADDPKISNTASRSVEVETMGPQKYINKESQTDIFVGKGGRELQLINKANGVDWGSDVNCGNINIQSELKDINILTKGEDSNIFIECLNNNGENQLIQIETKASSGGAIVLKTKGNILLKAESGQIQLDAPNILINTNNFGVNASNIDMNSSGPIKINGSEIRLNEGASPPNSIGDISKENKYGTQGITTF